MFHSKTVFILGAGASNEFGLPLGKELAQTVRDKVHVLWDNGGRLASGDQPLFSAVEAALRVDNRDLFRASQRIVQGLPLRKSIDDFLDLHQADKLIVGLGKAAITKAIVEYEYESSLATNQDVHRGRIDFGSLNETWLMRLMHMVGDRDPTNTFHNIGFISFNYDRSLERFLVYALQDLYALSTEDAAAIVKKVPIFHPYGTVGALQVLGGNSVFGGKTTDTRYVAMSDSILTYGEEAADQTELAIIHSLIDAATNVVFLGFAFHGQNVQLLTVRGGYSRGKNIFGTAHGISAADVVTVKRMLNGMFAKGVYPGGVPEQSRQIRNDLKCAQFMEEYALTLPRA